MNWFLAHWTYSHLVLSNSTSHIKLDVTGLSLQKLLLNKSKRRFTENKRLTILYYRVIYYRLYLNLISLQFVNNLRKQEVITRDPIHNHSAQTTSVKNTLPEPKQQQWKTLCRSRNNSSEKYFAGAKRTAVKNTLPEPRQQQQKTLCREAKTTAVGNTLPKPKQQQWETLCRSQNNSHQSFHQLCRQP